MQHHIGHMVHRYMTKPIKFRPSDKRAYLRNIFLISQPKHMFCVLKGVAGQNIYKMVYFMFLKTVFISANSADPDELPPYAAFHLGLHCLPK